MAPQEPEEGLRGLSTLLLAPHPPWHLGPRALTAAPARVSTGQAMQAKVL